jgi:hypothetical protein
MSVRQAPATSRSVFARTDAELEDFAVVQAASGFTRQGRTTHFTTFYGNGLLNHPPGSIILLQQNTGWRGSWSIIQAANFSGRIWSDLLFYDRAAGVGEFYATEGGNIGLLSSNAGWRTSWSIIVPCNLTGGAHSDLLFYDPGAGTGEMYTTDGHGGIGLIRTNTGWRSSWSLIVPCNLTGGAHTDLLFYDPSAGIGEMYRTDGHGNISLIATNTGWRSSWSVIAACRITGGPHDDLLFYDPAGGTGEIYRTDGHGGSELVASHTDWRTSWSIVKPCRISGRDTDDLLFYDPAAGVGEFYATDRNGGISLLQSLSGWRHTWSAILPANFTDGAGQDLLFYDPSTGTGEFYATRGNTLATAALATCEADYGALREYFGGVTPGDLPFQIFVQSGHGGASHGGCSDTTIHCDAFEGDDSDLLRMLVVAEADEVFMADQGKGWDCGASNGEGLSRVLATHRYPKELGGFETGPSWLTSDRHDFVTQNDGTDTNFVSTGCATLFIHYLKFQHGYSFDRITQAAGDTPADTYRNLTGRTDSFAPFNRLLERRFAAKTSAPLSTDNPFPIQRDLLFYDPGAGTGEFYSTDIGGGISLLATDTGWRSSWKFILRGNFAGRSFDELLFYDAGAGTGEFYETDGHGGISLLRTNTGWRSSWDLILPARFGDGSFDGLLFYDRAAGTGEIYATDGRGGISQLASHTDWRKSWTTILAGAFTRSRYPSLLFYDASAGLVELYETDAGGGISLVGQTSGLPGNWTMGFACNITCGQFPDVAFYAPSAGTLQFFTTDGGGTPKPLSTQSVGRTWSQILPTAFAELLFYDASAGAGEYFRATVQGKLTSLQRHTDWRKSWSIITPGIYS